MLCTEQVTEQEELPGYGRLGNSGFWVHSHQQRNQGCLDLDLGMGMGMGMDIHT